MFELYTLPIHLELGEELPEMPGLMVRMPPRKPHRSRSGDILIALLTPFEGNQPGPRTLENMLEEAAALYYKSRGSVTSGLRLTAEHLNHLFLKYNAQLQGNRKDGQIFAYLNLAVLRDDLLYIVHVGSTSSYLLEPDRLRRFHNDTARGRGLGISRAAPLFYFQTQVKPDDMLLLCSNPPATWSQETLTHGTRLTINLLRRRIINTSGIGLRAGMIQFKTADRMAVHRLRPKSPLGTSVSVPFEAGDPVDAQMEAPVDAAVPDINTADPAMPGETTLGDVFDPQNPPAELLDGVESEADAQAVPLKDPDQAHEPAPVAEDITIAPPTPARYERPRQGGTPSAPPVRRKREPKKPDPVKMYQRAARRQARRKKLASMWQAGRQGWKRFTDSLGALTARLLPGYTEESPQLSRGWMLFISMAIPLLVVTSAITVYLRNGRDQQHQLYLQQAQGYAGEARNNIDPETQRSSWNQVFHWLDLAEEYRVSEESDLLRKQAGTALDVLDGVERLDFNALMPFGFSNTLNFVQIAANDTEVYLLDSSQGRVLRLFLTGQGYELDNSFSCGPGASGTRMIGDLVDLIILPPGSPRNASVMGIDANGNLLYCIPGAEAPVSGELIRPLDGWGKIQAIGYYQGSLYVLDPLYGAVYLYRGYDMEFGDEPVPFFNRERDESIPNLREMIDLAAYGEDLYLLNENGTIAWCTSGIFEANQTRCDDPASFGDMRPGMSDKTPIFPNAYFAQVQASLPPDPSLFLLDINTPSIYRFSLQLNLDRLFQPMQYSDLVLPQPPATAFTVSPSRVLFLAYGNEVIYASLTR